MHIIVVGLNHHHVPIDVREKFYLNPTERELFLSELKSDPAISEALILSTCNRTEIYVHALSFSCVERLMAILFRIKKLPLTDNLKKCFYAYGDQEAIGHLFRVAAGLDSLILGEKQILGQIKIAAELSRTHGMMSKAFNILLNLAIRAGKKARSETQIDCGGSSVSWAAVTMAQNALSTLQGKDVLIIGAGKMGQMAVSHLRDKGVEHIYVTNRTHESAVALAKEFGGTAVSFWDIKEILSKVDVCICSASAPHYLIEKDVVEKAVAARQGSGLLLIDISMPRNINPVVASVKGVSLFAIDDLDKVVEENIKKRRAAVGEVEEIINRKISEFYAKLAKNRQVEMTGNIQSVGIERVLE